MLRVTVFNTALKIVHIVVRQLSLQGLRHHPRLYLSVIHDVTCNIAHGIVRETILGRIMTSPTSLLTCYPRRYLKHCTQYCSRYYFGPDYGIGHVFVCVLSTALPATLHPVLFAELFWARSRHRPCLCLRVAHNIAYDITNNIVRGVPPRYFYYGLLRFQNMTIPLYLHNFGNEFTFDAHAPRGYFAVFEQFALTA